MASPWLLVIVKNWPILRVGRNVLGREESLGTAWVSSDELERTTPDARGTLVTRPLHSLCQPVANACIAASRDSA